MIRFRILGPIEVFDDERRLGVGGPKQLALLAFLLVHANRPVSVDTLLTQLSRKKTIGRGSVKTAISRLRDALEPLGGNEPRLRNVPAGYVLTVGPGEL